MVTILSPLLRVKGKKGLSQFLENIIFYCYKCYKFGVTSTIVTRTGIYARKSSIYLRFIISV